MFGNDRDSLRRYYCTVWEKATTGQALEPLERLIAAVVNEHPEYQSMLVNPDAALNQEYLPETGQTNPFCTLACTSPFMNSWEVIDLPGFSAFISGFAAKRVIAMMPNIR